jgi:hypothetical protein
MSEEYLFPENIAGSELKFIIGKVSRLAVARLIFGPALLQSRPRRSLPHRSSLNANQKLGRPVTEFYLEVY